MFTRHVCGERCLRGFPEQRLTGEVASGLVNLARPYRLPRQFEYSSYGFKYWNRLPSEQAEVHED
jgi:hypothetical protein